MAVLRYIWCPIGKVGPKIALFPSQSAFTMAHLVPYWQSGSKKNSPISLYIWWPTDKVVPKIALFASMTVLWYIWWPTGKVVQKIALFPSQPILSYIW